MLSQFKLEVSMLKRKVILNSYGDWLHMLALFSSGYPDPVKELNIY